LRVLWANFRDRKQQDMRIIEIKVMRGPNYWSIRRHKLVQMKLDIEELEELPTNKIKGFGKRLEKLLPGLYEHHCSEGKEGGFLLRVKEGTWMGHVIEHIAIEIQCMAGMDCGFGRTRSTKTAGVYNVVFDYTEEAVGMYAARVAVKIAEALIEGEYHELENDILYLRELKERTGLGPSTRSIVEEAASRKIPFIRLKDSLVQLGHGKNQVRVRATMTDKTSAIAMELAGNKDETKKLLKAASIPLAEGTCISYREDLDEAVAQLGFPLVFKPVDGNHGKGVSILVNSMAKAILAFEHAQEYASRVIIEKFIPGHDFRVLVINHKFVAAALREPAHVKGDGRSTIQELIERENKNPRRGTGHGNMLTKITIDRETIEQLRKRKYTTQTVLKTDELCYLKGTANISTGGTATDVSEGVHPSNVAMFERISRIIGLDICGIDIMASNLHEPLEKNGGVVLEVNAAPGFRMHVSPTSGKPRNVAAPVIDMLYPEGKPCRIPIIAVTGTNGKTTTTRLIAHIAKSRYQVGYTTSDGIYIGNSLLVKGDTSGPGSAEFILRDPTVEFAALESARGGILRSGLAFDSCDVGVITNIQEDHMGLNDIHTLEEMALVKSVVIETVKKEGYGILNADNEHCVEIAKNANCKVAYFSMHENNPVIKKHCEAGGIACVCENGFITIKKGDWKFRICKLIDVPLTFNGKLSFMIQNVLAATLATYTYGFKTEDIASGLETFIPSPILTPGRMNIFHFRSFTVMIDFAHNPDGFRGIKEFMSLIDSPQKIGIITGTGDRRDEDIRELGRIAAQMFDHIIIRQDKHLRGRSEEEIVSLLVEGIQEKNPAQSYEYIPKEVEALQHAISIAKPGAFITALSDVIDNALEVVRSYMDKEKDIHEYADFE